MIDPNQRVALDIAIADTWRRLEEAGATKRNRLRGAVSAIDAEGNDSEDEVRRLWAQLFSLGSERRRLRDRLRREREDAQRPEAAA